MNRTVLQINYRAQHNRNFQTKYRYITLLVTVPIMPRQKPKLQIFFMDVNFQFTKAYNIPDTH
jgi:hypothetical protein